MMRYAFVAIFALLIATLILCSRVSLRSIKPIGGSVSFFCLSLIIPLFGNLLIIGTCNEVVALVGYYLFYIGMDIAMYALLRFTREYCRSKKTEFRNIVPWWLHVLFTIDVLQLLANSFFGHAFELQEIIAYGRPYYLNITHWGVSVHRVICYSAIGVVMVVFIRRTIKVPLLYKERYIVILMTLILGTLWQAYYVYGHIYLDNYLKSNIRI